MRRIDDPTQYEFLQHQAASMNVFITYSALRLGAVAAHLRRQLLLQPVRRQEGGGEPLEVEHAGVDGAVAAAALQLRTLPTVYRGPYEYSSPESREDFLPQCARPRLGRPERGGTRSRARPVAYRLALATAGRHVVLILLGGLVTNTGAALAVPDWPSTFGYNMVLFRGRGWWAASSTSTAIG